MQIDTFTIFFKVTCFSSVQLITIFPKERLVPLILRYSNYYQGLGRGKEERQGRAPCWEPRGGKSGLLGLHESTGSSKSSHTRIHRQASENIMKVGEDSGPPSLGCYHSCPRSNCHPAALQFPPCIPAPVQLLSDSMCCAFPRYARGCPFV